MAWVNNLSLKKKIIFYSYSAIIPILLIVCAILLRFNYAEMQATQHETSNRDIKGLSDGVDIILSEAHNLSSYIAISVETNKVLTANNVEELNQDVRRWSHMQAIEEQLALRGYIKAVAIYPENGVLPYLRCIDTSAFLPTLEDIKKTDGYKKAVEKRGRSTWERVERGRNEFFDTNRANKVVIYREIFDHTKQKPLGYLVLGVSEETIEKLCDNILQNEEESVVIFNNAGEKLTSAGIIPEEISEYFANSDYLKTEAKSRVMASIAGYDIYSYQEGESSAITCKIVPRVSVLSALGTIAYGPLALLVGVLLGLLPVLMFVSNVVTRPLRKVCDAMGEFKDGDFESVLEVEANDEVGEVAAHFNVMVHDIKELIDQNYVMELKERESELAALQAQITPHFLYNTLDSLYWQANSAGNDEIAENIYTLSQLFRLVLGQGQKEVPLEREMELVRCYLDIQKMRFAKNMDFKITMDENIEQVLIPKLILQPFVENSIIHGLGNGKNICMITVTASKKGERIRFCIKDTGMGMSSEQLQSIWEERQDSKNGGIRMGRYAISNIKERLELKYKENFLLQINSKKDIGTTVIIEIPIENGVSKDVNQTDDSRR